MKNEIAQNDKKTFNKIRWSMIAVFFIFNIMLIFTYKNPNLLAIDTFVVTALLFIIAVFNGIERYKPKNVAFFFIITLLVSFFFENLSIITGFPFGFYHYSPTLGMLTVPMVIIFAYFSMGYLS